MEGFDRFHINEPRDEDGNLMYDCESDQHRYKIGIDGAHTMIPFQCDICIFRTLFSRNPRLELSDRENLAIIRRLNLDAMWSREPSTIQNNIRTLNTLIVTCESSGFTPQLPKLGPFPIEDCMGYAVAFGMLVQSMNPGRHDSTYTQFATIRKQRSAFSNLYMASQEAANAGIVIAHGSQSTGYATSCPTNSLWFSKWSRGCEKRMGYILNQDKAISISLLLALIESFRDEISKAEKGSWIRHECAWV